MLQMYYTTRGYKMLVEVSSYFIYYWYNIKPWEKIHFK
jgi:hypothetical protein